MFDIEKVPLSGWILARKDLKQLQLGESGEHFVLTFELV